MKELLDKIHKPGWTWHDIFIIPVLLAIFFSVVGGLVGSVFPPLLNLLMKGSPLEPLNDLYVPFIGDWIVLLLYMRFTTYNRPILRAIGNRPRHNRVPYALVGILIGFLMNFFCAGIAMLNRDIAITFDHVNILYLVYLLVIVFIQSSSEELFQRGFVYQRIRKGYKGLWPAVLINSLAFAILHLGNPGISMMSFMNLALVGIFYSVCVRYFDSIWLPMGIHAGWNFTQHILLGLPNSGIVSSYSVFTLDAANARNSLAYDTNFGVEGTLTATLLHLVLTMLIVYFGEKKKVTSYSPWLDQQTSD